jgi:hypothetical protein
MSHNQFEYLIGYDFRGGKTQRNQGRDLIAIKFARERDRSSGGADVQGR